MMSLTDYAKRRGVSTVAVSKAVARGRLSASVTRDERGQPKISDPDLADREWEERTRKRADMPPRGPIAKPIASAPPPRETTDDADGWEDGETIDADARGSAAEGAIPPYHRSQAVKAYHAARREAAMADTAELELEERRGILVESAQVYADFEDHIAVARTKLLAIPSRLGQEAPELAARVVPVAERLIREALEELAIEGQAASGGTGGDAA